MSFSVIAYLNLSQGRPSLLRRVIGPLLGGLVGEGLDRSTSGRGREPSPLEIVALATGVAASRTMIGVVDGVEESTFYFLLPQRLGRLPVSNFLNIVFLFSDEARGTSFNVEEARG